MRMILSLLAILTMGFAGGEELIPREKFFANPERENVQLSPDGTHISYLANVDGIQNIWVWKDSEVEARPLTRVVDRPIHTHVWMGDGEHLLFLKDVGGNELFQLFVTDLRGNEVKSLTPEGARAIILKTSEKKPHEALIALNDRDPAAFDVYKVNVRTGKCTLVLQNTGAAIDFIGDEELQPRALIQTTIDGGRELVVWDGKDHRVLETYPFEEAKSLSLVKATDEALYYTDAKGRDKQGLKKFVLTSGAIEEVFYDETAECNQVLFSRDTKEPEVVFTYGLKQKAHVLNSAFPRQLVDFFKEVTIQSIQRSTSHTLWLIEAGSDIHPTRYYLYDDRFENVEFLFSSSEEIEKLPLARTEAHLVEARDGLSLPVYMTKPNNEKGLSPLVLFVHGGPWARDYHEYNSYRQFFANRGYAVLNVNYRGSKGLGLGHLNAGNRQWSKKMHDDLLDAVDWAVETQGVDPDRIAIVGGSYGGYAALVGLTFTPKRFAVGIDIVGPSHIGTLLRNIPPYWKSEFAEMEKRIGSLSDTKFMDEISPLSYVDRIESPLLVIQGANDPRVKKEESEQIVSAMQERAIPVTYAVFPDEGHGFRREENRIACVAMMEQFLSKHLGGTASPTTETLRRSSVEIPVGKNLIE